MKPFVAWFILISFVLLIIGSGMYLFPKYQSWVNKEIEKESQKNQEQELLFNIKKAEQLVEIAKYENTATTIKAKSVAEANRIIGESLKNNNEYLKYIWINALNKSNTNVIYIPTNKNGLPLPITKEVE